MVYAQIAKVVGDLTALFWSFLSSANKCASYVYFLCRCHLCGVRLNVCFGLNGKWMRKLTAVTNQHIFLLPSRPLNLTNHSSLGASLAHFWSALLPSCLFGCLSSAVCHCQSSNIAQSSLPIVYECYQLMLLCRHLRHYPP